MSEREIINSTSPESSKEEAEALIANAFKKDHQLEIVGGESHGTEVRIEYTNKKGKVEMEKWGSICMYWDSLSETHVISQLYLGEINSRHALRIFPNKEKTEYYTSVPVCTNQGSGRFRDEESPSGVLIGGMDRVRKVLQLSEKYLELFLLHEKYFGYDVNPARLSPAGLSKEQIRSGYMQKSSMGHFEEMLDTLKAINKGEVPLEHFNDYRVESLPLYRHGNEIFPWLNMWSNMK